MSSEQAWLFIAAIVLAHLETRSKNSLSGLFFYFVILCLGVYACCRWWFCVVNAYGH